MHLRCGNGVATAWLQCGAYAVIEHSKFCVKGMGSAIRSRALSGLWLSLYSFRGAHVGFPGFLPVRE